MKEINNDEQNVNILANEQYTLLIDNFGQGNSKWYEKRVNRFKENNEQTNFFYIKNIKTGECFSNFYNHSGNSPYNRIDSCAMRKI